MQTNCIFIASNFVTRPQILIYLVFKSEFFPILIANKIFHVTVVLLVYFYDQFVAPKIRQSRRHCSVCQQSTWFSVTRSIITHKYAQRTVTRVEKLKLVHLKCNLFAFSSISSEYLQNRS